MGADTSRYGIAEETFDDFVEIDNDVAFLVF
jgi:hypothetical protein